jgi:hypothetical protein
MDTNFKDISKARIDHFGVIFKEDSKVFIVEIVHMTTFFPSFVVEGIMRGCWMRSLKVRWRRFFIASKNTRVWVSMDNQ